MGDLKRCVDLDHWPGRHETVQSVTLPGWALDSPEIDFGNLSTNNESAPV